MEITPSRSSWRDYLSVAGKGMMMGAADVVPGVSGGTIAFITGIYEELIYSLKQCGPDALRLLMQQGFGAAWQHVNGNFLVALFSGVILSILTLSRGILHLLEHYPAMLWAFFFGLIVAGVWSVARHVDKWNLPRVLTFILGACVAYFITTLTPTATEATPLFVFLAGSIAICAMILPGISGSFILLLLGLYAPIFTAVKELNLIIIGLFGLGCIAGLLSFSRVLNWMFNHQKMLTLSLLSGFMVGALNKVWPWKITLETTINRHGEVVPLVEKNVLPAVYELNTGLNANAPLAFGLLLLGIVLVILMEKLGRVHDEQAS